MITVYISDVARSALSATADQLYQHHIRKLHESDYLRQRIDSYMAHCSSSPETERLVIIMSWLMGRFLLLHGAGSSTHYHTFVHRTAAGKPLLPGVGQHRSLSLSHTDALVSCGVIQHGSGGGDGESIGVDIVPCYGRTTEMLLSTRDDNPLWLACTHAEKCAVAQVQDAQERMMVLFFIWGLKESIMKALGVGFTSSALTLHDIHLSADVWDSISMKNKTNHQDVDLDFFLPSTSANAGSITTTTKLSSFDFKIHNNKLCEWKYSYITVRDTCGRISLLTAVVKPAVAHDDEGDDNGACRHMEWSAIDIMALVSSQE